EPRPPLSPPFPYTTLFRSSGQSSLSKSSSSRSAYAVMRIIHWRRLRLKTGKLPRSERPSAVISSLASTVPSPGHQLTGASDRYRSEEHTSELQSREISYAV